MRHVNLRRARLWRIPDQTAGSLPTILFVHGAWLGAWTFENFLGYFAERGVGCAAIDLRGHGGLAQDDVFLASGQREMAEDVVEACEAIGGDVVVAGHSAGAAVAAIAASRFPTVGLVLLAPSPPGQLPGLEPQAPVPDGRPFAPGSIEHVKRKFVPNFSHQEAVDFAGRLVHESPTLLNDRRLLRVEIDRSRISGPALCLSAEKELGDFHKPGQDLATARFYDAEYWFLTGAGHCFSLEPRWRDAASVIERWYGKHFRIP
ncbi:alpha/beta hydrolase [Pikeienuella sp. HZG-20]|uniref:alpha/beta hydrolase n=1 Tax=Paludibacillus litoralis TaxID=3133267 RepID=UPI0030EF7B9C